MSRERSCHLGFIPIPSANAFMADARWNRCRTSAGVKSISKAGNPGLGDRQPQSDVNPRTTLPTAGFGILSAGVRGILCWDSHTACGNCTVLYQNGRYAHPRAEGRRGVKASEGRSSENWAAWGDRILKHPLSSQIGSTSMPVLTRFESSSLGSAMFIREDTLDDLTRASIQAILKDGEPVEESSRGPNRELRGVLLRLTNPRARLSHTETKGKVFSAIGELAWYLTGSNDAGFITFQNTRM